MDILAGSTRVFDVRGDGQTSINGGLWVQQGGASYTGGLQVHSTQCVVMGSSGVVGDGYRYHVYIFTHTPRTTHTTDRHAHIYALIRAHSLTNHPTLKLSNVARRWR